jgi:hypothetical protein
MPVVIQGDQGGNPGSSELRFSLNSTKQFDYQFTHCAPNRDTMALDLVGDRLRVASRTDGVSSADCLNYAEFLWEYLSEITHQNTQTNDRTRANTPVGTTTPGGMWPGTDLSHRVHTGMGTSHSLWLVYIDTVVRAADVLTVVSRSHIRRSHDRGRSETHLLLSRTLIELRRCEQVAAHGQWTRHNAALKFNIKRTLTESMNAVESLWLAGEVHRATWAQQWDVALLALLDYGMCIESNFEVDACKLYALAMTAQCRHSRATAVWELLETVHAGVVPPDALYKSQFLNARLYGVSTVAMTVATAMSAAQLYGVQLRRVREAALYQQQQTYSSSYNSHTQLQQEPAREMSLLSPSASVWRVAALSSLGVVVVALPPLTLPDKLDRTPPKLRTRSSVQSPLPGVAADSQFVLGPPVVEPKTVPPRENVALGSLDVVDA